MCIPIGDLSILRFLLPLIYTTPALTPNNSDAGKKERKRERKKEKKGWRDAWKFMGHRF